MKWCVASLLSFLIVFNPSAFAAVDPHQDTQVLALKARLSKLSEEVNHFKGLAGRLRDYAKEVKEQDSLAFKKYMREAGKLEQKAESLERNFNGLRAILESPTPSRIQTMKIILNRAESEIAQINAQKSELEEVLQPQAAQTSIPSPSTPSSENRTPAQVDLEKEFERRQQETPSETRERLSSTTPYASEDVMEAKPEEVFLTIEKDFREDAGEEVSKQDITPVEPSSEEEQTEESPQELTTTLSPEEYAQKRAEELREKFKDRLETDLPVLKSIRVYDTTTGKERWLKDSEGFTFKAKGFGPRNSIRIEVKDKNGNILDGDYITLQKNVVEGSAYNKALESIRALELIRASYHVDPMCKEGQDPTEQEVITSTSAESPEVERDAPGTQYLPHCEVLKDGIQTRDSEKLKSCIRSIQRYMKSNGTSRCQIIKKLFSLNEKEQDFAALVFTTAGEAPAGLSSGSADHLMIMKSLKNRENAVKRAGWKKPLSALDLALVPQHYSMFNNYNGRFVSKSFLKSSSNMDNIIDSVIAFQSASWHPPGEINNITHYYSPPAMRPRNRKPWWARPSQNPNKTLREITGVKVNGKPVVNSSNSKSGYHRFYAGVDGPNNYATVRVSRKRLGSCQ